jgi:hypothetical protein
MPNRIKAENSSSKVSPAIMAELVSKIKSTVPLNLRGHARACWKSTLKPNGRGHVQVKLRGVKYLGHRRIMAFARDGPPYTYVCLTRCGDKD